MSTLSLVRRPSDMMADFDRYFNQVFNDFFGADLELRKGEYPRLNVYDEGPQIVIDASVPGLTNKDVRVDYQNGMLCICGESQNDKNRDNNNYKYRELHRSTFCRSLRLDERPFDINKIEAKVENGLLTIMVPRKDQSQFETKQIPVK